MPELLHMEKPAWTWSRHRVEEERGGGGGGEVGENGHIELSDII